MKNKKKPENTTETTRENPLTFLAMAMGGGVGSAIESQEKAGQGLFVNSGTLPTKMSPEDKVTMEKVGCVFHGEAEGDPLFQYVTLPEGWKKERTGHSMWSKLVDQKGRKRAMIFYKAAFYDRDANLSLTTRYSYKADYEHRRVHNEAICHITDADKVIHTTPPVMIIGEQKDYLAQEEADRRAKIWLDAEYPEWKDPSAYWAE